MNKPFKKENIRKFTNPDQISNIEELIKWFNESREKYSNEEISRIFSSFLAYLKEEDM